MQFGIYNRIKYRDDGRDLVTGTDFFCIHVSVSFMNSWLTYQLFYIGFISFSRLCSYPVPGYVEESPNYFCPSFPNVLPPRDQYYYNMFLWPSKACILIMLLEAVVYLADYKDIIFSSGIVLYFVGMLMNNL